MEGLRVWNVLAEQGRQVKWLARAADIPVRRLYGLKTGAIEWWQYDEARRVAEALGVPLEDLFDDRRVLPPGRKRPLETVGAA